MLVSENPYIPVEDRDFFILLRIGLWQKITPRDSEILKSGDSINWNYIYKLSCEQTVQGIVADGIEIAIANGLLTVEDSRDSEILQSRNPSSGNPEIPRAGDPIAVPQEIYDKFLAITATIIQRNLKVNQLQAKLCQLFDDPSRLLELFPQAGTPDFRISEPQDLPNFLDPEIPRSGNPSPSSLNPSFPSLFGLSDALPTKNSLIPNTTPIKYVVLKGQAVAQSYPKPLLRVSGDIDFMLPHADYYKAKALLLPLATSVEDEYVKNQHLGMTINDLEVELHGSMKSYLLRRADKKIAQMQQEMFEQNNLRTITVGNYPVQTAYYEMDILINFFHIMKHLIQGIGLRQITDFAVMLNAYQGKYDPEHLQATIKSLKVQKYWDILYSFSVYFLGLNIEETNTTNNNHDLLLWQLSKEKGNFAHKYNQELNGMSSLKRAYMQIRSFIRFAPISPYYSMEKISLLIVKYVKIRIMRRKKYN